MKEFKPFLKTFLSQWKPLSYGVVLSLITLIASISLITLSGWFLTSCALAGLLAISFNYLLPSAGVRFFATTKTASRWGDLMLTHDALFKVTTKIRIHIFSKLIPITPNQNLNFKRAELFLTATFRGISVILKSEKLKFVRKFRGKYENPEAGTS